MSISCSPSNHSSVAGTWELNVDIEAYDGKGRSPQARTPHPQSNAYALSREIVAWLTL
jgi:hypothetical protein